jgi:hypothetical protein
VAQASGFLQIIWPDHTGFALFHAGDACAGWVPGHGIHACTVWPQHTGQATGQHVPHVHSSVSWTQISGIKTVRFKCLKIGFNFCLSRTRKIESITEGLVWNKWNFLKNQNKVTYKKFVPVALILTGFHSRDPESNDWFRKMQEMHVIMGLLRIRDPVLFWPQRSWMIFFRIPDPKPIFLRAL